MSLVVPSAPSVVFSEVLLAEGTWGLTTGILGLCGVALTLPVP